MTPYRRELDKRISPSVEYVSRPKLLLLVFERQFLSCLSLLLSVHWSILAMAPKRTRTAPRAARKRPHCRLCGRLLVECNKNRCDERGATKATDETVGRRSISQNNTLLSVFLFFWRNKLSRDLSATTSSLRKLLLHLSQNGLSLSLSPSSEPSSIDHGFLSVCVCVYRNSHCLSPILCKRRLSVC